MLLLSSWLTNIIALYVAALIIPGITFGERFLVLAIAGLVFGLVNVFVKPVVVLLTLPAVILSFGIALFFINALMLYLTSLVVPAFELGGLWSALGGAVIVSLVNFLLYRLLEMREAPR